MISTEPQIRIPTVRSIPRDRVDLLLDRAWQHRVTTVVAPPGSGKTTALVAFATRSPHPVAWIGYPTSDSGTTALLSELHRSVSSVASQITERWNTVADAVRTMAALPGALGIVIDNVHRLAHTPAEHQLAELINAAPQHVSFVLAGRRDPDVGLATLALAGQVLAVDGDDLRFRTWEAERLFREQYQTFLPPDDVARVARHVGGWAAGLQLFHLASRGRDPAAQRRLIDQMQGRNKAVREYLATNVLGPLDIELREFLIDTCVLGVVTPGLADELRGATDSAEMLEALARDQLFTTLIDDDTYRYHDVLRSHLEQLLIERSGAAAAELFRVAGRLQLTAGFTGEALRCYARAGDWEALRSILGDDQLAPAAAVRALFDGLPRAVIIDDPWLLLARARLEVANGHFDAALRNFDEAISAATGTELIATCRSERAMLTGLLRPGESNAVAWITVAHNGMRRNPLQAAEQLATMGPTACLAGGLLALIGGDFSLATSLADRAFADPAAGDLARSATLGLQAIARLARGQSGAERNLDEATEYSEREGIGWVTRILRAAEALTDRPSGVDQAVRAAELATAAGDDWGAALAFALGALGQARRNLPATDLFDLAQRRFQRVGAGAPAAVCALAKTFDGVGDRAAAVADARHHGVGLLEPALLGLLGARTQRPPRQAIPSIKPDHVELRLMGPFEFFVGGKPVDLGGLRPKARTLLKLLAITGAQPVSRDTIIEAVWPNATPEAALHNLQVAVSAVRRLLATEIGESAGIVRWGTSYRLDLGSATALDISRFDALLKIARDPQRSSQERLDAAQEAMDLSRGELLADDGAADWLQEERARREVQHEQLAALIANEHLASDSFGPAIETCETALLCHRYCDELWRTLIAANHGRGDAAGAKLAEARYAKVLAELSS